MPSDAPSSKDASPSGTAFSTGTTVYSAAVPHWLCQPARYTHTRSPIQALATPSPTASITPAPSCPGTWKSKFSDARGAGAGLPVGRVHARHREPHEHLARPRLWRLDLADLQHLGAAGL